MTQVPLLALFFEIHAFEELDQDSPQLAKKHLRLVFALEMYWTWQVYLSLQMTPLAMRPDLTLVMASELAVVAVVGEWFSVVFVGNWWRKRRTDCFEVSLWTTMTKG